MTIGLGHPPQQTLLHQQPLSCLLNKLTLIIGPSVRFTRELKGGNQEPGSHPSLNLHHDMSITAGQEIAISPRCQAYGVRSPQQAPLLTLGPTSPLPPRLNEYLTARPSVET
jgi:hypothetical protein